MKITEELLEERKATSQQITWFKKRFLRWEAEYQDVVDAAVGDTREFTQWLENNFNPKPLVAWQLPSVDYKGNLEMDASLSVAGDLVVYGNLTVHGPLFVGGSCIVTGSIHVYGNIEVIGDVQGGLDLNVWQGPWSIVVGGDLIVRRSITSLDGDITVGGNLHAFDPTYMDMKTGAAVYGHGSVNCAGILTVGGDLTATSVIHVGQHTVVGGEARARVSITSCWGIRTGIGFGRCWGELGPRFVPSSGFFGLKMNRYGAEPEQLGNLWTAWGDIYFRHYKREGSRL